MKTIVTKEITICDLCSAEVSYPTKCLGCGLEVCHECETIGGEKFKHGVSVSGSGDGFYCTKCMTISNVINSPLFRAYMKIKALRLESENAYTDFDARRRTAENIVKIEYERVVKP